MECKQFPIWGDLFAHSNVTPAHRKFVSFCVFLSCHRIYTQTCLFHACFSLVLLSRFCWMQTGWLESTPKSCRSAGISSHSDASRPLQGAPFQRAGVLCTAASFQCPDYSCLGFLRGVEGKSTQVTRTELHRPCSWEKAQAMKPTLERAPRSSETPPTHTPSISAYHAERLYLLGEFFVFCFFEPDLGVFLRTILRNEALEALGEERAGGSKRCVSFLFSPGRLALGLRNPFSIPASLQIPFSQLSPHPHPHPCLWMLEAWVRNSGAPQERDDPRTRQ